MKTFTNCLDWKICNCARCQCELLGASMLPYRHSLARLTDLEFVWDRINERPYCQACHDAVQKRTLAEAW